MWLVEVGDGGMADDVIAIGHNFEAVLGDLELRMREAAADLNFEEAAASATKSNASAPPSWRWSTTPPQNNAWCKARPARMPGRRNTAKPRICRQPRSRSAAALPQPAPANLLPPPLRGRVGVGGPRVVGPSKVHNPISTKCTVPTRCPIAPTAPPPRKPSRDDPAQAAEANLPANRLAPFRPRIRPPPRVQAAARRGIEVGGRRGECKRNNYECLFADRQFA